MYTLDYSDYVNLISRLKDAYGVTEEVEHKYIHIMREGPVELFRLIFGYNPENKMNHLYVSFHLDINPVDSIMWFQRIYQVYPETKLLDCYYKDHRNETYVGQEAEVIRQYISEQQIISNWELDKEQTKKYTEAKIVGRDTHENVSFDPKKALEVFSVMVPDDDDIQH